MKKRKFFKLFISLSPNEIKQLGKFGESSLFNSKRKEEVLALFNYLIKESKREKPNYDEKVVFEYIAPQQAFKQTNLDLWCSDLFKLMESFLSYQTMTEETFNSKLALAKVYRQKQNAAQTQDLSNFFSKNFNKNINYLEKVLVLGGYKDENYWHKKFLIENEKMLFFANQRLNEHVLQDTVNAFQAYSLANLIKQRCFVHSKAIVTPIGHDKYDFEFSDILLGYLDQKEEEYFQTHSAIAIYYYLIKSNQEESYFQKVLNCIYENEQQFTIDERRDIYLLACNYCIGKANKGEDDYLKTYVELNLRGMEQELFLENGVISPFFFRNIVVLIIRTKEYRKAAPFIENYKHTLPPKIREDLYNLCMAKLHYALGDFKEASFCLARFNYFDPFLALDAKNLEVRINYETGEYDLFITRLNTMEKYLYNKKEDLSPRRQKYYQSLLGLYKKLDGLMGKQQIKDFKELVEQLPLKEDKEWFYKQLNLRI